MSNPNTTYEIYTTMTSKPMGASEDDFRIFHDDTERFDSLDEVKEVLTERYGKCKREKIYVGHGEHVGWLYCFKADDWEGKWYQRDWVTVHKVESSVVIV